MQGADLLIDRAELLCKNADQTLSAQEVYQQLDEIYCPNFDWKPFFTVDGDTFCFSLPGPRSERIFSILLANADRAGDTLKMRNWRTREEQKRRTTEQPFAGLRIGIDPGHIGGEWAEMEERCFRIGEDAPVKEGDLTLKVAQLLKPLLEARGAEVFLVRESGDPVTSKRPEEFWEEAHRRLLRAIPEAVDEAPEPNPREVAKLSERLFYRSAEIIARRERFRQWKPDIVLCLHFNGTDWSDPAKPSLVQGNNFHVLVNGAYSATELATPEVRLDLLERLFAGTAREEIALAESVATVFARETGLPPMRYSTPNAVRIVPGDYVWARNLIANRIYPCPVLFLEPYVANSTQVYARIQAGDFDGLVECQGVMQQSIFREYAHALLDGLEHYYGPTSGNKVVAPSGLEITPGVPDGSTE